MEASAPDGALEALADVIERVSDSIVALNKNWVYTYVDARAAVLLGRKVPADLLGRVIWEEYPEAWDLPFAHAYRRAMETQEMVILEDYYAPWDRWFENRIYPSPAGLTIYFTEITDRKRAEAAALANLQRYQVAVQAANLAMWEWDIETQAARYSSDWCRQLGLTPSSLGSDLKEWRDRLHPDEGKKTFEFIEPCLLGNADVCRLNCRMLHESGEYRHFDVFGAVIREDDGTATHVVISQQDCTERVETERRHRHAQKLESVGRLAGGVAHDLNNMLTVIGGNSNLATRLLGDRPDALELISEILEAVDRAQRLSNGLLTFSRNQVVRLESIDLSAVVAGMKPLLERLVGVNVSLQLQLSENRCSVLGDRGQLEQVVMNLAVNARDAMGLGGTLTISTALANSQSGQATEVTRPDVRLSVSDTGAGMDEDLVSKVFEPYFTTKEDGKGSGLGLAIVHGIVAEMGAEISVESQVGAGTQFVLRFPGG